MCIFQEAKQQINCACDSAVSTMALCHASNQNETSLLSFVLQEEYLHCLRGELWMLWLTCNLSAVAVQTSSKVNILADGPKCYSLYCLKRNACPDSGRC